MRGYHTPTRPSWSDPLPAVLRQHLRPRELAALRRLMKAFPDSRIGSFQPHAGGPQ